MKKIIIVFMVLSLSFVLAQGQKIGYVNIEYIYAQNEDARLAYADFEKEGKRLQVEYESKAITLDSLVREYQKLYPKLARGRRRTGETSEGIETNGRDDAQRPAVLGARRRHG